MTLHEFLSAKGSRGLVLTGGPGIGKTTLWEAGIAAARRRRVRVLSTRAREAPARLAFAGLVDLLDGVDSTELGELHTPQRRALEIAVLRAEPTGRPPELRAIALGFLNLLRALAGRRSLLIAIDDVQWLDRPSAEVLEFAAPRLETSGVRFLLTKRPARTSPLERAIGPSGVERLDVGPLSLGGIRQLLHERLGLSLPRHLLRRLVDSTLGNPLFALELGRTLSEGDLPGPGDDLPVPDTVEDLLGTRIGRLPAPVRRLLLAVALSPDLTVGQLAAIANETTTLDEAVEAGVLIIAGNSVRAAHPLIAAAAKKRSRPAVRRELHFELARVVDGEELRARHLALAAVGPDQELAETVEKAAAAAFARGARREAVELAEHALGLTPPESAERSDRLLALAGYLETAGERQRVTDLLTPQLDSLPEGGSRVRAWLLLSEGGAVTTYDDHAYYFARALAESRGDPGLRAAVLASKALNSAAEGVEGIRETEAWALEALAEAPRAGSEVERLALSGLGWARVLRGLPIDAICERFRAASVAAAHIVDSPEPVAGLRLVWRGDIERARVLLTRFLSFADERGEAVSYAWMRLNLCELGLRSGAWDDVSRLLDEWAESEDAQLLITPTHQRCRALLAAGRGFPDEAEQWATQALADATARGYRWQVLESLRARGIAALLAHEPARAVESLREVWEYTRREGVDEPGAFPVAPELVEALVELGELEEARAVTARLRELAEQQEHPWGLATARRCDGLIGLAIEYDDQATAKLELAAAAYDELGLRFDSARSLLALGRAQRRRRKWGAARRTLERAKVAFAEIGSAGWADTTRAELDRVGARRPQPSGELSPAERRVAELAGDGLANKEIAQALFVSVKTVEGHLSHVYAKLGVRSRAQLARRLSEAG